MACFDGDYPIELPEETKIGKHLLEGLEKGVAGSAAPVVPAGYGAGDALQRP
jgi:amidophosphoribosyltransferase